MPGKPHFAQALVAGRVGKDRVGAPVIEKRHIATSQFAPALLMAALAFDRKKRAQRIRRDGRVDRHRALVRCKRPRRVALATKRRAEAGIAEGLGSARSGRDLPARKAFEVGPALLVLQVAAVAERLFERV